MSEDRGSGLRISDFGLRIDKAQREGLRIEELILRCFG